MDGRTGEVVAWRARIPGLWTYHKEI
jgi:hypothetical protein